jgi:hypothetical protein
VSHGDYVRPGGLSVPEFVPTAADYQRWDALQTRLINGDDGGDWAPSSPIVIGGQGMALSTAGSQMTGGATTTTGGKLILGLIAGDFPVLFPSRLRTLRLPILGASISVDPTYGAQQQENYITPVLGASSAGVSVQNTSTLSVELPRRYLHNGARIASLAVHFYVRQRVSIPTYPIQVIYSVYNRSNLPQYLNPSVLATWGPTSVFFLGQYCLPNANQNGYYFKCTVPGTTGGSEPNWTSTVGATIPDGGVTWVCVGRNGYYPVRGASADSYYNGAQPQTVAFDTDGLTSNVVDTGNNRYAILISNPDATIVITGVSIAYDSISSLAFQ